jgi:SAM-dependent methyltransferase
MNRKQRRTAQKNILPGARRSIGAARVSVADLFERAGEHHKRGELDAAAQLYNEILTIDPDHARACDRLGLVYLAQGKRREASTQYSELARIAPQTLNQFTNVVEILKELTPSLASALAGRTSAPRPLAENYLASQDFNSIAADPYFRTVLESTIVRNIALERWLTALRAAILRAALADQPLADAEGLAFCSALAQQCFNNEYVFPFVPDELEQIERLKAIMADTLGRGAPVRPIQPIAFGMYAPLHTLPGVQELAARNWPQPAAAVVKQQVSEPLEEQRLRASIPCLTAIDDGVTAQVRQQYEENPYPRWVRLAAPPNPLMVLDDHVHYQFPAAAFRPVGRHERFDVLVAGCGTGRNALEFAQGFRGAHVLGVDISLASLANAKRHTPPALADAVEFAQGDIMALGSIGRGFDLIIVGGVLHHMADPLGGWRELLKLTKPNGLMQVGLYSAHARRDIVAARALIASRGYRSTPDDIRRCRQDLLGGKENFQFIELNDFFTISECRDLLFHVHEQQFTIPEIKEFIARNDLNFVGFEFSPQQAHVHHHRVFAENGWLQNDLDRWDAYERADPRVFAGMYIFWVQKNKA